MLLIIEALLLISAALKDHRAAADDGSFPMNMQLDSVDDDFIGCENDMVNLVVTPYLPGEEETMAWQNAAGSKQQVLTENEVKAIRIWTGKNKNIYGAFNEAVRTGKQKYKAKNYGWYKLHFFLTSAIRKLKNIQTECVTTYRRTHSTFVIETTEVRFGSFAASSFDKEVIKKDFGEKSCFEIYTCFGAHLKDYSEHPIMEEVLIPPYETFKVEEIKEKKKEDNLWCETVYKLRSSGVKSVLRCEIVKIINSEKK